MKELSRFKKVINTFPIKDKTTSLLIQVLSEESVEAQLTLIKNLTNRDFKVIVLSGGRPCRDLISIYKEKKIKMKNIHIIDMICKSHRLNVKNDKTVTHMDTIHSLTQISIYINKMVVPNKTVLFVDSITSMLIYNDERIFHEFLSHAIIKMKRRGVHLILMFIKTKNYDEIRAQLKYLCDREATF